jgi:hypothetical protein
VVTVQRLSGGLTPGSAVDPRTFPAIWNAAADVIDGNTSNVASLNGDVFVLQDDVGYLQSDVASLQAEAVLSTDVRSIVALTQAEYDDIAVPDPETLYVITD